MSEAYPVGVTRFGGMTPARSNGPVPPTSSMLSTTPSSTEVVAKATDRSPSIDAHDTGSQHDGCFRPRHQNENLASSLPINKVAEDVTGWATN